MKPKDWKPTQYADTKPQVYTEDEATAARLEQRKAVYEFFRHLMTLDSVALVLVATLIEKVFLQPLARGWVGAAVLSFLLSLVGGGFAYLTLLGNPLAWFIIESLGDGEVPYRAPLGYAP